MTSGKTLQYIASISASLTFFMAGSFTCWTSPALPKLMAEHPEMTPDKSSWIVSFMSIGSILAPLPTGRLMDVFGRKPVLAFTAVPFLIGWALIFTNSVTGLYISRVIGGVGVGIATTVCPVYIGEISEDDVRGVLGTMTQLFQNLGTMFSFCLGPYVSYEALALTSAIAPIVFFIAIMWSPETPYFFIMKGQRDKAEMTVMRLRGEKESEAVNEELEKMERIVHMAVRNKVRAFDLFSTKGNRRAMFIILILVALQQFSGVMAICLTLNKFSRKLEVPQTLAYRQ